MLSPMAFQQVSSMGERTRNRPRYANFARRPVEPTGHDGIEFDHVGQFYSSEGMTDELANIMVLHLRSWRPVERHFDGDEHVESAWVSWYGGCATFASPHPIP